MSNRFLVAEARARFGELLDQVDKGEPVVIERRGVQYALTALPAPAPRKSKTRYFESVDPAVMTGEWTWQGARGGLRFTPRRVRKPR